MKKSLLIITIICCSFGLMAQKNVVKVRPLKPALNAALGLPINIPLAYERVIISRLSAQVGFNFSLPGTFSPPSLIDLGNNISTPNTSSIGVSPELRFYLNPLKDTPRGLYLAGGLNYKRNSMDLNYTFSQDIDFDIQGQAVTVPYERDLPTEGYVSFFNYGLALGTQKIFLSKIVLDIKFIGVYWGVTNMGATLDGQLIDVNSINSSLQAEAAANGVPAGQVPTISANDPNLPTWADVANVVGDTKIDIPILEPEFTTDFGTSSANVNLKMNMPFIQLMNFSIGFAF